MNNRKDRKEEQEEEAGDNGLLAVGHVDSWTTSRSEAPADVTPEVWGQGRPRDCGQHSVRV